MLQISSNVIRLEPTDSATRLRIAFTGVNPVTLELGDTTNGFVHGQHFLVYNNSDVAVTVQAQSGSIAILNGNWPLRMAPYTWTHFYFWVDVNNTDWPNWDVLREPSTVDTLNDTVITNVWSGDTLTYDDVLGIWVNRIGGLGIKAWGGNSDTLGTVTIPPTTAADTMWYETALPVDAVTVLRPASPSWRIEADPLPNITLAHTPHDLGAPSVGLTRLSWVAGNEDSNGDWFVNVKTTITVVPLSPSTPYLGVVRVWASKGIYDAIERQDVLGTVDVQCDSEKTGGAAMQGSAIASFVNTYTVNAVWPLATNNQHIDLKIANMVAGADHITVTNTVVRVFRAAWGYYNLAA